jgi:tetratricopeptide (TPR) repeat protein
LCRCTAGLFPLIALILANPLRAEYDDRVTVRPAPESSPIVIVGEIEEYNARRIVIRVKAGMPVQTFPADAVLDVETHRTQAHIRGLAAVDAGDLTLAETEFIEAANNEARAWVRQEVLSWLVRCARRGDDRLAAGRYFVRLVQSDPETRYWSVIPLIWSAESVSRELRTEAQSWLGSTTEGVQLLGASMLLFDQQFATQAGETLDRLVRSTDRSVQSLARAQAWRLRLIAGDVTPNELLNWRESVERMPESLRGGPMYLIGRAASGRSDLEQAAADWLWLPLVYDDDEPLAARACYEAAQALDQLGRSDEAVPLYDEVLQRYGWSPFAADARQRLLQLADGDAADPAL